MNTEKRIVGYEQEYPGAYRWPIYEMLCPVCNQWSKDFGDYQQKIDGVWVEVCQKCGEEE